METEFDKALSKMILSASGWRGIFAENGDEESSAPEISGAHTLIAAAAAQVFAEYLSGGEGAVIVGRDTRPTGEAIADAVIRALVSSGRDVMYTGVAAAPEIMAYARFLTAGGSSFAPEGSARGADSGNAAGMRAAGFIYISASHNPIGHNGIKFGLTDGGVLKGSETAKLVSAFKAFMASPLRIEAARSFLDAVPPERVAGVYAARDDHKKAALAAYRDFTEEVISGAADKTAREEFFAILRDGLRKRPVGIAADFNGSARAASIDREFLPSLGAGFGAINDIPGMIAHRIVPEGESLEPCRIFLETAHRKAPSFILGYTPDCDGDRGNLVIWDERKQTARTLEAQEVFALACVAELSSLVWSGALRYGADGRALTKAAVAVNDPTSLRIDRIARAFDAGVFRAEVGEANVVELAGKLREKGYLVRILGEGSAGGTITHPSAVRDPIDTLGAMLKLLSIRSGGAKFDGGSDRGMGLFEIWCERSGQKEKYREDFTLADVIASLPAFVTTGAYTADAVLKVKAADHGMLKNRYQKIFLREWEEKKTMLGESFGVSKWEAIAYNGTEERRGISVFGEAGRGGLKIEFTGSRGSAIPDGTAKACIWMRGSGTEPVFRIMADAPGPDPRFERVLLEWQRKMVIEADNYPADNEPAE